MEEDGVTLVERRKPRSSAIPQGFPVCVEWRCFRVGLYDSELRFDFSFPVELTKSRSSDPRKHLGIPLHGLGLEKTSPSLWQILDFEVTPTMSSLNLTAELQFL